MENFYGFLFHFCFTWLLESISKNGESCRCNDFLFDYSPGVRYAIFMYMYVVTVMLDEKRKINCTLNVLLRVNT